MSPEQGAAAASKNVDAGNGSTVASPVRHMHRDVAELLVAAATSPRRRRRKNPSLPPATAEALGRARYGCAFEEEGPAEEDGPPRLVWVNIRDYPWWPGQVFDPSDASACALRERPKRRRDAVLVACFGDGTFVWADAEDLLPFRDGFPRLADIGGRSSLFIHALDDALDEVSRRVDAGLSCACCAADIEEQVVQNFGVRRGARGAAGDAAFARDALRGEAFVPYLRALAVAPGDGADRLDLAVAASQMKALTRWRNSANPEREPIPDVANGAMVVAARAGRGRGTTPRRARTRRGLFRGDAPAGDMRALSMCERAAAVTRDMFSGEYASAVAVTPPVGAERGDVAVATTAQGKALEQWRGAGITECTATRGVVANGNAATGAARQPPPARRDHTGSRGGDHAEADPGNWRILTTCISDDSACETDTDDDASETESEDFEPELGWKDKVIMIQFIVILMLLYHLMMQ